MAIVKGAFGAGEDGRNPEKRPSREQAEAAVRTLLRWAGADPTREGLVDTPARVASAYEEWFAGYDEMVILRNVRFESHCEHHIAPIIGHAHIGYLPDRRVVGISKLARLVEGFAKRLQIQEKMTAEIAGTLDQVLQPKGVGVVIEASHACMSTRGIHKPGATMVTSQMIGAFREDPSTRREFLAAIGNPVSGA